MDRCQARVARPGAVAAVVLEVFKERADQRRVEVVEVQLARLFAGLLLCEAEQQPECVSVGGDRLRVRRTSHSQQHAAPPRTAQHEPASTPPAKAPHAQANGRDDATAPTSSPPSTTSSPETSTTPRTPAHTTPTAQTTSGSTSFFPQSPPVDQRNRKQEASINPPNYAQLTTSKTRSHTRKTRATQHPLNITRH